MKRVISFVLAFLLLLGCFSVSASADNGKKTMGLTRTLQLYGAGSSNYEENIESTLSQYVSVTVFINDVKNAIANCQPTLEVTDYNLPATQTVFNAICDYIFYECPEIFNVDEMGCEYWTNTGKMASLNFTYHSYADTSEEYADCKNKMQAVSKVLLAGIQDNDELTDEQKLLLLHDRLVVWNEYGYSDTATAIESHSAYGAFVNRISVCQGYTMAYMYLLDSIGIESYYCSSEDLNHAWNIVYLDGKKYHVDVTWDDAGFELGAVGHDNFLRSSEGIYQTGHEALDYDTTPTDTKYDNYFWQNSDTEFQLVDNEIYYVDSDTEEIRRYSDKKRLCSVAATWEASDDAYWVDNFTCLSSDGSSLFYSQPKAIYKYDLITNISEKIYTPSIDENEFIFSFTYEAGNLICDIYNGSDLEKGYQIIEPYRYNDSFERGDVTDDGVINNKDLGVLMQYLNGWDVNINTTSSDVNGDEKVNNKDYGILMQYLNGWDVELQ